MGLFEVGLMFMSFGVVITFSTEPNVEQMVWLWAQDITGQPML